MASTTSNMKLRKPAPTDTVDVTADISDNLQKIDDLSLMNRGTSTQPTADIYWSAGTLVMGCNVKADRLAVARCSTKATGTQDKWYRVYTADITARAMYRIEFDSIRSGAASSHGISVGMMATASTSGEPDGTLSGYNSAPSTIPVKIARYGDKLEIWIKSLSTNLWVGNVVAQYGPAITSYEGTASAEFGDETGPVVDGPTYDGTSTYKVVLEPTQRGRGSWYP